ncbi:MAG: ATP-binding protein [Smithellaceae bacterium]|nr:ATP-binding protein [Smithellaceae bacterium]
MTLRNLGGFPFRVAALYGLIAGLWILLSDRLISELTTDPTKMTFLQTYKGWGFVGVTAILLYVLLYQEWNRLRREISARKMAEDNLMRLNMELEERVARRTAELARAKERAEAADRVKSAFLATMSHELRTPLNAIIGFTGIMLQGLPGSLSDEQRKQLAIVQNSGRHLLNLINDVLDISKIEAGELSLDPTVFDIGQSIEKAVKMVSPLAGQKGIAIETAISGEVGAARNDQRRVEQVLINMLNNAVKFTEEGRVLVSGRREGDQYVLTVSDTGVGIAPDELAAIFKPFHQSETGRMRRHEGTGLGLSICRKILDMMGGTIGVASTPGQGSTFTVRFPIEIKTL